MYICINIYIYIYRSRSATTRRGARPSLPRPRGERASAQFRARDFRLPGPGPRKILRGEVGRSGELRDPLMLSPL